MTIRILNRKDAKAYRDLRLKSYSESALAFSESYEDEVKKDVIEFENEIIQEGYPQEYFVAGSFDKGNNLNGFVKFVRDKRSKARHKSFIHAMYVDPEFRGMQIGKHLVDYVINKAKEMIGLEQIHLWVLHAEGLQSASKFYRKIGFEQQGPFVKKDLKLGDQYIDAEYMVMYLD